MRMGGSNSERDEVKVENSRRQCGCLLTKRPSFVPAPPLSDQSTSGPYFSSPAEKNEYLSLFMEKSVTRACILNALQRLLLTESAAQRRDVGVACRPAGTWKGRMSRESRHAQVDLNHAYLSQRVTNHRSAMASSGLISAATFLIVIPTALVIRLFTLLNLNAVVLYYPSGFPSRENWSLASFDNNSTLESDLEDGTADFLPSWLTHIIQNHNLSQSTPQWRGRDAPVVVSIHLTVDFAQPPVSHSFDQMVGTGTAEPKLQNGSSQAVSLSNATAHLHGKSGFDDHKDNEPRTEKPFQPTAVINFFIHALGLTLVCFSTWRQASDLRSSYHLLLRMVGNSRVTTPFRGHNEYAGDRKDLRVPSYEDVMSEGKHSNKFSPAFELDGPTKSGTHHYPPTHTESSIREWTSEDDYETDVTNIIEPDTITPLLQDLMAGSGEPHLLRIASDSSLCSRTLFHLGSVSRVDSDCAFVDAGVMTCLSEREISPSCYKLNFGLSCPRSRRPSGSLHLSLSAEDSELGTSGTLDFCSVGDDQHIFLKVSKSGYFTNTEVSSVHRQPDSPCRTPQETSIIHIPRQLASQWDPSTVTSRELVLYLQHQRAWEVDDLVAAWRCFVRSRGGRRWVTCGIVGVAALLHAVLANFLASSL